jgi:hypothetical protein
MTRVRFPAGQDFSLLHNVQTGSGAHSASYPAGSGVQSSGVKQTGRESNDSPAFIADVENAWRCTSTLPCVSMVWCLVKHKGQPYHMD